MSRALYRRTAPRRRSKCRCTPVFFMITKANGEVDSTWLGIDTLSTYCMTNDLNDFIGKMKPMNEMVAGVSSNKASITAKGSGIFKNQDDQGVTCNIYVPELYYCESVPYKVLSPQHLDCTWRARRIGTFSEATDEVGILLMWKDKSREHTKRVVHTGRSGIPLCHTAPSYKKYKKLLVQEKKYQEDDEKSSTGTARGKRIGFRNQGKGSTHPELKNETHR
jgi:hypothetical protein